MSWEYVRRAGLRKSAWGSLKVWIWDLWSALLAWYDIDAGPMPKSWRTGS